jgi:hypothetical protein
MVDKNKNNQPSKLQSIVSHIGFTVLAAATIVNMFELADREGRHAVGALQPNFAYATIQNPLNEAGNQGNDLRRSAREEISHTSATFGVVQRSPSTTGKR